MSIEKIENGRAAYAFSTVKRYMDASDDKNNKEYRSYIKKMPAMIQVNGLGQAIAFCFSKGKVYGEIYRQLADWIKPQYAYLIGKYDPVGNREFIDVLVNMDSRDYKIVTVETIALLNWMKRFADGIAKEQ